MAIFNSYVKLPDGNYYMNHQRVIQVFRQCPYSNRYVSQVIRLIIEEYRGYHQDILVASISTPKIEVK